MESTKPTIPANIYTIIIYPFTVAGHNFNPPLPPIFGNPNHSPLFNLVPKLEFSKFDGSHYKVWVIKVKQYFELVNIEEVKRVKMTGLHFEGKANIWYTYYQVSCGNLNWRVFQNDAVSRFENPENLDVQELFNKLKQINFVANYEEKY